MPLLLNASKRRTWWYVMPPAAFGCACDSCGGSDLDWSEFKGMVWCRDCELDTQGTGRIFSGPIPVTVAAMLGIHFDIWHDRLKRVLYFHPDTNQYWSYPPGAQRSAKGGARSRPKSSSPSQETP